jgi:site-specific recombinase XerD
MSSLRRPRITTQTVSVYTRHLATCAHQGSPYFKRCGCRKYLYLRRDGKSETVSAKTRSWSVAEEKAAAIRDSWDPVKQKLRELDAKKDIQDLEAVSVDAALERWLKTIRGSRKNDNTFAKYQTMAKQIAAWTRLKSLAKLHDISADHLDEWITSWNPKAKRPEDRIGKTTAGRRLEMVKRFFKYCVRMKWIAANPAADFDAITPEESVTLPLLSGRYEAVLEATYRYDEDMRPDDRFGAELRAVIELMRWSGLRIGDALKFPKSALVGNRLTVTIQKSQRKKKTHTVIIPDQVCEALRDLPARPTVDPRYFFWSGTSKHKSLTGQWQRKLQRLNQYLNLVDYDGELMKFHSHQLRDTFAVHQLLAGTSMQDLSLMLAHESIRVTEKYYAPWVPERQVALELKMTQALAAMGAKVSGSPEK